jgi:DNA-directed RNA polymerase subunit RPC12/RpoP
MGVFFSVSCSKCDYTADNLLLGPAPLPQQFDPQVVRCAACKKLLVMHKPEVKEGCPECKGPVAIVEEGRPIACPQCGETLSREFHGFWD